MLYGIVKGDTTVCGGLLKVAAEGPVKAQLMLLAKAKSERAQLDQNQVGFEEMKQTQRTSKSFGIAVNGAHQKETGKGL
jgi:hypothetical protein